MGALHSLVRQAENLTRELLLMAARHYRISAPDVVIRFDLCGKAAGQACMPAAGRPVIRYNTLLLEENGERFIARTVPHEAAHVLAFRLHGPRIRPHGPEWREVMDLLGADSRRCHDYDTSRCKARTLSRHNYHCNCREHELSSIRHNRIMAGQTYYCRACKQALQPGKSADCI